MQGPLENQSPSRRAAVVVFIAMNAIYFFAFFQRVAVPGTIFDELQGEFGVSASVVAGLGALYLYIYGAMQLVAGLTSDRFGAGKVVLVGGLLLSLGSLLFPLSPSTGWLFASRALVGLGASLIYISIVKAIDVLFGARHFAQLLGVTTFLGYSGGLTGTFPFERAVSALGWRSALFAAGVLCAGATLAAALLFRKTKRMEHRWDGTSPRILGVILRNPRSLPVVIAASANFAIYFLVQATVGKKFLSDYCGLDSKAAASFTFVMMFTTMCAALSGGFLSHLIGGRRKTILIAAIGCVLASSGLILLGLRLGMGGGWFLACYVLLALSSAASPLGSALMKEVNPPGAVGTAVGVSNGASYLGVAILSNLAGFIMDRFQSGALRRGGAIVYPREAYEMIFLICLGVAAAAMVVSFFVKETHGKPIFRSAQE